MARSNRNGRSSNLDHLENEVSEVTTLLKDNVEKVLERGERIDTLQSRSEDLEYSSTHFKKTSKNLRKKMCWQNCKMNCIIALVIFLVIAVIVTIVLVETKPWEHSDPGPSPKPGKSTTPSLKSSSTTPRSTKFLSPSSSTKYGTSKSTILSTLISKTSTKLFNS